MVVLDQATGEEDVFGEFSCLSHEKSPKVLAATEIWIMSRRFCIRDVVFAELSTQTFPKRLTL